jgi:hypothetical protein
MNSSQREYEYTADALNLADINSVRRILNMAAEDGWELVSITPAAPPGEHIPVVAIWKRRLSLGFPRINPDATFKYESINEAKR